jgi:hypothetical protein
LLRSKLVRVRGGNRTGEPESRCRQYIGRVGTLHCHVTVQAERESPSHCVASLPISIQTDAKQDRPLAFALVEGPRYRFCRPSLLRLSHCRYPHAEGVDEVSITPFVLSICGRMTHKKRLFSLLYPALAFLSSSSSVRRAIFKLTDPSAFTS